MAVEDREASQPPAWPRPLRLFMVAAEPSGDALGGGLARALNARAPGPISYSGIGGHRLEAFGVTSPFDIAELSVLGYVDGLLAYPRVVRRADETAALALKAAPDAAVLIDSWGFTLRVAQRLRRALPELTIIKYAGPQVWASRPARAATLARCSDHVLTLQLFEAPYFEAVGLPATFVGHPALDEDARGDGPGLRARYGIGADQKVVLVLFGSRPSEVRRIGQDLLDTVAHLKARYGEGVVYVAPLASSVATQVRALGQEPGGAALSEIILVDEPERADAFAAGDVALACSGTVTTELARAGVPTVVAYRLGAFTHILAKRLYKAPYISLINMAAGAEIMPEFMQEHVNAHTLGEAVSTFLDDPDLAHRTRARLGAAVAAMRGAGDGRTAAERAADATLGVLADKGLIPPV